MKKSTWEEPAWDETLDDDDEEEEMPNFFPLPFPVPDQDSRSLRDRGIIILVGPFTKEIIEPIIKRMWALHFDEDFNEDIQFIINSPGGYSDIGWALIDTIEAIRLRVRTIALGEICSLGVMVFVTGDERIMSPNTLAMIHNFSSANYGNYDDLVASRKGEDLLNEKVIKHFIKHSKYRTKKQVAKNILLGKDHWLDAKEMKEHGLADKIFRPRKKRK